MTSSKLKKHLRSLQHEHGMNYTGALTVHRKANDLTLATGLPHQIAEALLLQRGITTNAELDHYIRGLGSEDVVESSGGDSEGEAALVGRLRDVLGAKLVVDLAALHVTAVVDRWADPAIDIAPPEAIADRLRVVQQVATLLGETKSAVEIRSWFADNDPGLDYLTPAAVIRNGDPEQVGPMVLAAARRHLTAALG